MKPSHRVFAYEFLRSGDQVKAYRKAYPTVSDNAARSAANRLLQNPEIAELINNIYSEVREEVMTEFRERLVDLHDLKVCLSQMIRGELLTEREVNSKGGIIKLQQQPGFTQILRAADMLAKFEGWYILSAEEECGERKEEPDTFDGISRNDPDLNVPYESPYYIPGAEVLQEDQPDETMIAETGKNNIDSLQQTQFVQTFEKNIDSLQQITTKSFAVNSEPVICDFTTKPQKMMRINRKASCPPREGNVRLRRTGGGVC